MALTRMLSSNKSPDHSSSKTEQKKTTEFKKRPTCVKSKSKIKKEKQEDAEIMKNLGKCHEQKVDLISHPRRCVDTNSCAMKRAQEVQDNLPLSFPSCVKFMLRSHVTGGFWLSLPRPFCLEHLPKHDETVVLVGEYEKEYQTKYLVDKTGLSGGWRGFSIAHKLLEGDVLVFQLIQPCKFKVYIVRANGLTEIDGAIGLLNLECEAKPIDFVAKPIHMVEEGKKRCEASGRGHVAYPESGNGQVDNQKIGKMMLDNAAGLEFPSNQSGNESEDIGSDVLDGIRFSDSAVEFKDVNTFEAFNILVDGLVIDSELPQHIRIKYYELCCSQKCYLHERLLDGLNFKLIAGIISETVNIADAIRAAKLITSRDYLKTWDRTLKSFEDLGMTVGFLRKRLNELINISQDQQQKTEAKKAERAHVEEEIKILKSKLLDAEKVMESVDAELEALKSDSKKIELTFAEAASTPW